MKKLLIASVIGCSILCTGCETTADRVLDNGDQTQLQKRSYQSRSFDTSDKAKVMNATIATLQDFGFIINKADFTLGSVSASRFQNSGNIVMTVVARSRGAKQIVVRTNAQFGLKPIEDPKLYQDFYSALSKSLFLQANNVD